MVPLSKLLLHWFKKHGRKNLPWQNPATPYRVWLSEIMLQQTQVKTVIPYFNRFIHHFPDIETLAHADEDSVFKLWAGLGYYARVRNLHKTAKILLQKHKGCLPQNLSSLIELPGIGRSTAGAILSLAYHIPSPILDGNVKRVLTRLYGIAGWPGTSQTLKKLWILAETHTPKDPKQAAQYTQAIMDLGATLCTRTQPQCDLCPVKKICKAHQTNTQLQFPHPKPQQIRPVRPMVFLIFKHAHTVLMIKRPNVGLWGGLWSFPEYPIDPTSNKTYPSLKAIKSWCLTHHPFTIKKIQTLKIFRHTLTHFHADILPVAMIVQKTVTTELLEKNKQLWYSLDNLDQKGVSTPVKKLLSQLANTS